MYDCCVFGCEGRDERDNEGCGEHVGCCCVVICCLVCFCC